MLTRLIGISLWWPPRYGGVYSAWERKIIPPPNITSLWLLWLQMSQSKECMGVWQFLSKWCGLPINPAYSFQWPSFKASTWTTLSIYMHTHKSTNWNIRGYTGTCMCVLTIAQVRVKFDHSHCNTNGVYPKLSLLPTILLIDACHFLSACACHTKVIKETSCMSSQTSTFCSH